MDSFDIVMASVWAIGTGLTGRLSASFIFGSFGLFAYTTM